MTSLGHAFSDYACNQRASLRVVLETAIQMSIDDSAQIQITMERDGDSEHPMTVMTYMLRDGNGSGGGGRVCWTEAITHYRQPCNQHQHHSSRICGRGALLEKLRSVMMANFSKIRISSPFTDQTFHSSNMDLFN